ncbi:MAG TPA: hypothetical protein VFL64_02460 [Rhizobacter sp.]|nr:hypothetical protein [Rhizobacter sp.]
MSRLASLMLSVASLATLAACGGGGGSDSPPPPAPGVSLSGVAATGAALAGATVEAKCRGGSTGSATAAANGSYSIALSTGSLPCMLRATSGATVLHSVAQGGGTAHLTPATQLIVASIAGTTPAAYYGAFNDAAADALTPARVQAAHANIVSVLTQGGVNASTVGNLLNGTLVAAVGGTAGNAYDQALDALALRLTARGLSLATLTDQVVRASPANTTQTTNTASLPPQALLQPASATCSALRSGTYRVIVPQLANAGEYSTGTGTFNATTGVFTDEDGPNQFTPTGTPCSFTTANGAELVVSQAGVVAIRTMEAGGVRRLGIAFPEQVHAVADLAGAWQSIGFERADNGTYYADSSSASLSAAGALTNLSYCENITTCQAISGLNINVSVNASGGFNLVNSTENWTDRLFAYRAGNGDLMLVVLAGNGSFSIWTPQRATSPVAVGTRQLSWGLWAGINLQATSAIAVNDYNVTAADATTWTRVAASDGHSETVTANSPRNGWVSRADGTAPTTGGGTVTVRGFNGLVVRGMGMSALSLPTLNNGSGSGSYYLSVNQ